MKKLLIQILFVLCLFNTARAVDYETPITYTAWVLAADFAALHAFNGAKSDADFKNFKNAWEDPCPRMDDDNPMYNFIWHPLMGSETYLRAREGDFGILGSIAFTFGASFTWEYLIESWTEHPSAQDLLLTTGVGWVLGEIRYYLKQECKKNKRTYFWVDPIWSTLEYFEVSITQKDDDVIPVAGFRIPF